jgi:hypothetical protein
MAVARFILAGHTIELHELRVIHVRTGGTFYLVQIERKAETAKKGIATDDCNTE